MKAVLATVLGAVLAATGASAPAVTTATAGGGPSAGPGAGGCARHQSSGVEARVRPGSEARDVGALSLAQRRALEDRLRAQASTGERGIGPTTVPVRVHVIQRTNGTGGVTNAQIADQIDVINRAFTGSTSAEAAQSPFTFEVRSTDRTRNTDWYRWTPGDDDTPAKRALHEGGRKTLNIYVTGLQRGLLGYATFPVPEPLFKDGVVLLNESLPGGTAAPYNRGDTATHEIGHWLALYHTFQNGCAAPGDQVADTPKQDDGDNVYSCDETLNTCAAPGKDPVHNFMSYGTDICLNMFTSGQVGRMVNAWEALRDVE